jgi:hypothetical protein
MTLLPFIMAIAYHELGKNSKNRSAAYNAGTGKAFSSFLLIELIAVGIVIIKIENRFAVASDKGRGISGHIRFINVPYPFFIQDPMADALKVGFKKAQAVYSSIS